MVRPTHRQPGRPAATDQAAQAARETLIQTAARLFAEQGFEGTSLRQVADGAAVTPAMVAYYFQDKAGLLEAVVREGLTHLLEVVKTTVEEHPPGEFVPHLIRHYLATLCRVPWIPQIMIREVISKNSPLRTLFIEEFAAKAAPLASERLRAEVESGKLKADLDPRYAILSLIGMCLFPFIAQPVLGPLLGFAIDERFAEDYGAHVLELFVHGTGVDA